MLHRARRLRAMLLSLAVFLAAVAALNFLANPYGAWRSSFFDSAVLTPGAERIAAPFHLRIAHPTTLIVGNSRTAWGMQIDGGERDGLFNASLPGADLGEIDALVQHAARSSHLRRVIWGVDMVMFDDTPPRIWEAEVRNRLAGDLGRLVTEALLSLDALDGSRKRLSAALHLRSPAAAQSVPWEADVVRAALEEDGVAGLSQLSHSDIARMVRGWVELYNHFRLSKQQMDRFRTIVEQTTARGITVTLAIMPCSEYELEVIRQTGHWETFKDWKRSLATVAPYWDFSGYQAVAETDDLFLDVLHFKPGVGHVILRRLLGGDCDACGPRARMIGEAGVWVDARTVGSHLAAQDAQRIKHTEAPTRYASAVADVVRRARSDAAQDGPAL